MAQDRKPETSTEVALHQAYRALALADRDRQTSIEREHTLAGGSSRASQAASTIGTYHNVLRLEHANADLRRCCRDAEVALRDSTQT